MKGDEKLKIGVVWGVRGHPKSSETPPFDRAHMTSYSTMRLFCIVFELGYFAFFVESGEF